MKKPKRKPNVFRSIQFTFATLVRKKPLLQRGIVTLRKDGVAIQLLPDENEGYESYRCVAKRFPNGSYSGGGIASNGCPFRAHFAELARGSFMGYWIENDEEFWFRFALDNRFTPKKPPPNRNPRSTLEADDHAPLTAGDRAAKEREARIAAAAKRAQGAMAVHGEGTRR